MELIKSINDMINAVVWGIPMLILIIGTGIYFSVRLGFFQITKFKHVLKTTIFSSFGKKNEKKESSKKSLSQFQAMSTALAATIGTGNIAGVASALAIGGAGAVFWMWVSAFFGMMTSFAENVLGVYYRRKNAKGEWSGGAMYFISEGFRNKKIAKVLSVLFAVFCVLASFGIGNMSQVNSIAVSLQNSFNIPPLAVGIALAVIVGFILIGGVKRIGAVAEKIVPFMAVLYIILTLTVVIVNYKSIPTVFSEILKGAFGFDAVAGGISGALIKSAITLGFKRGVFSNEAGLGSAVIVNSTSDVKEPVVQGMWGVFEVFFDTIVVCSLTAFTVLSTGIYKFSDAEGAALVSEAFSQVFTSSAGAIVSVSITLFAFTTVLGWSFYGSKSLEYLFGHKVTIVYKIIFSLMLIVGATMNLSLVWGISDTLNGLMAIPNLIGVLVLSGQVVKITKNYIDRKFRNKKIQPMLSAYKDIQSEMEEQSDSE